MGRGGGCRGWFLHACCGCYFIWALCLPWNSPASLPGLSLLPLPCSPPPAALHSEVGCLCQGGIPDTLLRHLATHADGYLKPQERTQSARKPRSGLSAHRLRNTPQHQHVLRMASQRGRHPESPNLRVWTVRGTDTQKRDSQNQIIKTRVYDSGCGKDFSNCPPVPPVVIKDRCSHV